MCACGVFILAQECGDEKQQTLSDPFNYAGYQEVSA
jgi:hypothetical protein